MTDSTTTTLLLDAPAAPAVPEESQPTAPVAGPETQHAGGRENAFAITSFVLGIASIVSSWTFIAPIVGLVLGVLALRRNTSERTLALWGVWMNAAMLALTVLAVLAMLLVFGVGLIAALPVFTA